MFKGLGQAVAVVGRLLAHIAHEDLPDLVALTEAFDRIMAGMTVSGFASDVSHRLILLTEIGVVPNMPLLNTWRILNAKM